MSFRGETDYYRVSQSSRFYDSVAKTYYTGFKGPTSIAASVEWTLPVADSTGTQALVSNGSGTLSWSTITGGTGANPSASVGLSAVNGVALTFLRSDGAPALSQSIVPTWTGLHSFEGGSAAAVRIATFVTSDTHNRFHLQAGGKMEWGPGSGVVDTTFERSSAGLMDLAGGLLVSGTAGASSNAGLDVEAVAASNKTFAKFGSSKPVYIIGEVTSGDPALAFNGYYDTAWKFGKGSSSEYSGIIGFTAGTGIMNWYVSTAAGNADGAMTPTSIFSITAAGVVKIANLTASATVITDASSNLTGLAHGTEGYVLKIVSGVPAWALSSIGPATGWSAAVCSTNRTVCCAGDASLNAQVLSTLVNDLRTLGILGT